jgi:hypothetical protein
MTLVRSVVVGAVALAALTACGAPGPKPTPVPTPMHRLVKIDQSKVPEGVISYVTARGTPAYGASVEGALKLHTPGDVRLLEGAPDDFRAYMRRHIEENTRAVVAELASKLRTVQGEKCKFTVEIRVWGVAPSVATGRERGCGQASYDVIWAKESDTWRLAARMQGGWDCAELKRYRIPADITAAVCWYGVFETRAYDGPGR